MVFICTILLRDSSNTILYPNYFIVFEEMLLINYLRYQNKVLKCIVNAPWYIRNSDLHRDLGIETVTDIIARFAKSHEKRLQDHINIEAYRILNVNNNTRRLKRKKPFELVIR
jgi:hypothetical protein